MHAQSEKELSVKRRFSGFLSDGLADDPFPLTPLSSFDVSDRGVWKKQKRRRRCALPPHSIELN
jgi:hypothetical protein